MPGDIADAIRAQLRSELGDEPGTIIVGGGLADDVLAVPVVAALVELGEVDRALAAAVAQRDPNAVVALLWGRNAARARLEALVNP